MVVRTSKIPSLSLSQHHFTLWKFWIHVERGCLKCPVSVLRGGLKVRPFPPKVFFSINLMSWNFYMVFWDVILEWYAIPNILYRRGQPSSTLFRGLWIMVDFPDIVKITTFFRNFVISRNTRFTDIQRGQKFLNFSKNRFLATEPSFDLFMEHYGICDIFK